MFWCPTARPPRCRGGSARSFPSLSGLLCGPDSGLFLPARSSALAVVTGQRAPLLDRKRISNRLSFVTRMLLVNVSAILIECIDIYPSFRQLFFVSLIFLFLVFDSSALRTPDKRSSMKILSCFFNFQCYFWSPDAWLADPRTPGQKHFSGRDGLICIL